MPRSEAEGSSSDADGASLLALSDLSSPCGGDDRPSAGPASDAAMLVSERNQVEPDPRRLSGQAHLLRRGVGQALVLGSPGKILATERLHAQTSGGPNAGTSEKTPEGYLPGSADRCLCVSVSGPAPGSGAHGGGYALRSGR